MPVATWNLETIFHTTLENALAMFITHIALDTLSNFLVPFLGKCGDERLSPTMRFPLPSKRWERFVLISCPKHGSGPGQNILSARNCVSFEIISKHCSTGTSVYMSLHMFSYIFSRDILKVENFPPSSTAERKRRKIFCLVFGEKSSRWRWRM